MRKLSEMLKKRNKLRRLESSRSKRKPRLQRLRRRDFVRRKRMLPLLPKKRDNVWSRNRLQLLLLKRRRLNSRGLRRLRQRRFFRLSKQLMIKRGFAWRKKLQL